MRYVVALFILSPLLGFIVYFKNILHKNSKPILISFFAYYGATMIFPEGTDGSRHLLSVQLHYTSLSFSSFLSEFWQLMQLKPPAGTNDDLYLHILSYIAGLFGNPKLLYVFAATIYGYFYVNSTKLVFGIIAKNGNKILWLLFVCFVFWKSFEGINSIRNWTGAWVVFYATLSYLVKKEKKYIYLIFFACFIHFAYTILIVPILISFFLPKLRTYYFVFYLVSLFVSIPLSTLETNVAILTSNELAVSKFEIYKQDAEEIQIKNAKFLEKASVHKAYAVDAFKIFFETVFIIFLFFIVGLKKPLVPNNYLVLSNASLLFLGFSNIFMFVPSLAKRFELNGFFYLLLFMVLAYNFITIEKLKSLKKFNYLMVIGLPIIGLFVFMQLSYIAEFSSMFLLVTPLLMPFFYEESATIKVLAKELVNIFS